MSFERVKNFFYGFSVPATTVTTPEVALSDATADSSSIVVRSTVTPVATRTIHPAVIVGVGAALMASGYFVAKNRRFFRWLFTDQRKQEERLLRYVFEHATEGDAESVLAAIDEFGRLGERMMHVGASKGQILDDAVRARAPKVAVELGAFCGYSAVRTARLLPKDGHLYSIEFDARRAAFSTKIVEFAGLASKVTILYGTLATRIATLKALGVTQVDFAFVDHLKEAYTSDVQLLEQAGLVKSGTVIVADNCLVPGAPEYVKYITTNPAYEAVRHEALLGDSQMVDHVYIATRK